MWFGMRSARYATFCLCSILVSLAGAEESPDGTNAWYGTSFDHYSAWFKKHGVQVRTNDFDKAYPSMPGTIPVLAEVRARLRAEALRRGEPDPDLVGYRYPKAVFQRIRTSPPLEEGETRWGQAARHLMMLMGVAIAGEDSFVFEWSCPTQISVQGSTYTVSRKSAMECDVLDADARRACTFRHFVEPDGKQARIHEFAAKNLWNTSLPHDPYTAAYWLKVFNLDPATNLLYVSEDRPVPLRPDSLIYKNVILRVDAVSNAYAFAAALLNAGLPEEDRVEVPPPPQGLPVHAGYASFPMDIREKPADARHPRLKATGGSAIQLKGDQ